MPIDFSYLEGAAPQEESTPVKSDTANVTIRVDADSMLLCDGEYIDQVFKAGVLTKIQMGPGQHLLEFLYTEDPDIKIEKEVDFPEAGKSYLVLIKGLKELVDAAVKEAKKKAEEEAEAKRKAVEEAQRLAEEAKRKAAEEEAKRIAEEEAKRKAEEEARRKAEEARVKAEAEAKRKAEEAKSKAEKEAKRKAEEEALVKAAAKAGIKLYDVVLVGYGGTALAVVWVLKRILGVSMRDAHDLIFRIPCIIKKSTKSEADDIKKQLEDAGAKVEIR